MGLYVTGLVLVAFVAVQLEGIHGVEDWNLRQLASIRASLKLSDVDCYTGSGENYRGTVGVTETNEPCLAWNSNDVVNFRAKSTKTVPGGQYNVGNHNFCRNPIPGIVTRPWCYVASKNDWAFCPVSKCTASASGTTGGAQRATVTCPAITPPTTAVTGCAKGKSFPVGHKCWVLCPTGQKIMTTECQATGKWSVEPSKMTCSASAASQTGGSGTGGGSTSGGIGPLDKVCPALNVPTGGFSNCKGPQRIGATCGVGCLGAVTTGVEYIKTTCMSDQKWTKPTEFTATNTKLGCAGSPVIPPNALHVPAGTGGGGTGGSSSTTCYKVADKGKSYRGNQAKTAKDASGVQYDCLKWDAPELKYYFYNIANFPNDKDGIGKHNFCRNPAPEPEPWCYYMYQNKVQFKSCGVPKCP
ncbi:PREDICTED: apolipoprotein(a)-like [Branchiostoma belcheri]|uniref:Apolipoprotein(A)-like n=1 Tax=Branchiostoma belcheri TaxID=7741 RepID=A0A6P4YIV6_BRABE|nr:PREDICTED: apolipoprotein(a)-like [Branchiostoma belcheri]